MVSYNESIYVDRVAYKQVVLGSIAWARANHKGGILMVDKFEKMESGLRAVLKEWDEGSFKIVPGVDEEYVPTIPISFFCFMMLLFPFPHRILTCQPCVAT